MLVPAILYKDEIIKGMQKYFYTDDMMFETGCMDNWTPNITECPEGSQFQYAIVDNNEKLIGYLAYAVDWYTSKAYNFGLFSFDRGNPLVGRDVFNKLEELVSTLHRVEWRAVGGNPACRGYDNFIKRHNGNKHILKDCIKDRKGDYHDDIIYEIVKRRVIDADLLIERMGFYNTQQEREENAGQIITLEDFDNMPTAYDVNKVVEQLETARDGYSTAQLMTATNDELVKRFIAKEKAMNLAIKIVKAGGKEC